MRCIAADKPHKGSVEFVFVVTTARHSNLSRTCFTADTIPGWQVWHTVRTVIFAKAVIHDLGDYLAGSWLYHIGAHHRWLLGFECAFAIAVAIHQRGLVVGTAVNHTRQRSTKLQRRGCHTLPERSVGILQIQAVALVWIRNGSRRLIPLFGVGILAKLVTINHVTVPGVARFFVDLATAHLHQQPGGAGVQRQLNNIRHRARAGSAVFFDVGNLVAVDLIMCRVVVRLFFGHRILVKRRGERQRLHSRPNLKRSTYRTIGKHRSITHLKELGRIIRRIRRHSLNRPRSRIHNQSVARLRLGAFQPSLQNIFELLLHRYVNRRNHTFAGYRLFYHIIFIRYQRHAASVGNRLELTVFALQLAIKRLFDAILPFAFIIHKPQYAGRQRTLRVGAIAGFTRSQAFNIELIELFLLLFRQFLGQNRIARIALHQFAVFGCVATSDSRCLSRRLIGVLYVLGVSKQGVEFLVEHNRYKAIAVVRLNHAALGRHQILLELATERCLAIMIMSYNLQVKSANNKNCGNK